MPQQGAKEFDPSKQPPAEMLKLYRLDTKEQLAKLNVDMGLLRSGSSDSEVIDRDILLIQKMRGLAKLMHFDFVQSWLQNLEAVFVLFKKNPDAVVGFNFALLELGLGWIDSLLKIDEDRTFFEKAALGELNIQKNKGELGELVLKGSLGSEPKIESKIPIPAAEAKPIGIKDEESDSEIDVGMMELFKADLEGQLHLLDKGLLALEQDTKSAEVLSGLMRAAHSLKGAAKVVRLEILSKFAHLLEDCFVAVQKNEVVLGDASMDILFSSLDFLKEIANQPPNNIHKKLMEKKSRLEELRGLISAILNNEAIPPQSAAKPVLIEKVAEKAKQVIPTTYSEKEETERELRITAVSLNKLMGLAGESLVESHWLQPFSDSLMRIKKDFFSLSRVIDSLKSEADEKTVGQVIANDIIQLHSEKELCRKNLNDRLVDLELFINRQSYLSDRLYHEAIQSRMRPFGEGVEEFPRMVRDVAHQLKKKVRLEISGKNTPVDRDILEKLQAPLGHILRNSVDHGIESPEQRAALGKPVEGTIHIKAQHIAGMLSISISDDGAGIDIEQIKKKIVEKRLAPADIVEKLSEKEIIDFLFLPGFSTASEVSEISGRGVGLNVVREVLDEISGNIQISFVKGKGVTFNFLLPLTLSVIRALIVEIASEPYAFPLGRIEHSMTIWHQMIELLGNQQYFKFEGKNIGLVPAWQIFGKDEVKHRTENIPIVVIKNGNETCAIMVDAFLGEKELVVNELDPRLGKVELISAGAVLEDGSPVLIVDIEDMMEAIDKLLSRGGISQIEYIEEEKEDLKENRKTSIKIKKILVVDDSATVREVECRALRKKGYFVEGAINGVEAWNSIRKTNFDLVISDLDMPRMTGMELLETIRADQHFKNLPVMIVSFRDRPVDRKQAMDSGANLYFEKSGFDEASLLDAVSRLIGPPLEYGE